MNVDVKASFNWKFLICSECYYRNEFWSQKPEKQQRLPLLPSQFYAQSTVLKEIVLK